MQLEQSDAPSVKDPADFTFDSFRPINPTKRAAFDAFMQNPSRERHDVLYTSFMKKQIQNILTSGGWWHDIVSDST